ncbi:MAG: PepSY-associated TM helix domain-containing protein [Bacteroidetes bacterium]|nr:PepSY-associated TM helix domain-containing protein [Bacteroidota bacterium]
MNWRKIFKVIHRDLGYICFGLVIIYSVSGIAVNHFDEWNPNYIINKTEKNIILPETLNDRELIILSILDQLAIKDSVLSSFQPSQNILQIFLKGKSLTVNFKDSEVQIEEVKNRTGIKEMNSLHLNVPKKLWTYVADLFALSLIILGITGLFIAPGNSGLMKRGKWFVIAGILLPIIFLLIYQ